MQIKTIMRHLYALVEVAKIEEIQTDTGLARMPSFSLIAGGSVCKMVQPLWKAVSQFLMKLNIQLPHEPAIPLLLTQEN